MLAVDRRGDPDRPLLRDRRRPRDPSGLRRPSQPRAGAFAIRRAPRLASDRVRDPAVRPEAAAEDPAATARAAVPDLQDTAADLRILQCFPGAGAAIVRNRGS